MWVLGVVVRRYIGREPEGSVGTKLVNKAHGDFWEGIHP